MKKISILIPCYNEKENVGPMSEAIVNVMTKDLPQYDYELVFIDNDSKDGTIDILRGICAACSKKCAWPVNPSVSSY
jgi:glycosyltransferase involved in cell wall biosynthesis